MSDLLSTASLALEGNTSMSKDRTKRLTALLAVLARSPTRGLMQARSRATSVGSESSRRALGKAAAISAGKGSTKITKAKLCAKIVKVVLRAVAQRVEVGTRGTAKRAVLPDNTGIMLRM
jgi:hypothetical protein